MQHDTRSNKPLETKAAAFKNRRVRTQPYQTLTVSDRIGKSNSIIIICRDFEVWRSLIINDRNLDVLLSYILLHIDLRMK